MAIRGFLSAPTNSSSVLGRLNVFSLAAFSDKFFRDLSGAIEHRDRKTFRFHVQDEIFAHDTETDQANITLIRVHFCISYCGCSTQKELL